MIAVWIPVTVVPTSLATVAIDTFMTELSSVIRNCAEASVSKTIPLAACARPAAPPATASRLTSMQPALIQATDTRRQPSHASGRPDITPRG